MSFDPKGITGLAEEYTAAWNSGSHVVYLRTFPGHAARTANALTVHGWEDWDVGDDLKVKASRGWYDSEDYARQVAGGIP